MDADAALLIALRFEGEREPDRVARQAEPVFADCVASAIHAGPSYFVVDRCGFQGPDRGGALLEFVRVFEVVVDRLHHRLIRWRRRELLVARADLPLLGCERGVEAGLTPF